MRLPGMRKGGRVAQTRMSGATRSAPVASPSHQRSQREPKGEAAGESAMVRTMRPFVAAIAQLTTPAREEVDNVANALEGEAEGHPAQQVDGGQCFERVPGGNPRCDPERDAARYVPCEGSDRDGRPEARPEEEERGDGDPGRRPDGRDDAVGDGEAEAELRSSEVDGRDEGNLEGVPAWVLAHDERSYVSAITAA
jgi:hypothetical protein